MLCDSYIQLREFKRRENVKDEQCSGRQIAQNPEENIQKVHQMLLENLKMDIESIVRENT